MIDRPGYSALAAFPFYDIARSRMAVVRGRRPGNSRRISPRLALVPRGPISGQLMAAAQIEAWIKHYLMRACYLTGSRSAPKARPRASDALHSTTLSGPEPKWRPAINGGKMAARFRI